MDVFLIHGPQKMRVADARKSETSKGLVAKQCTVRPDLAPAPLDAKTPRKIPKKMIGRTLTLKEA
jgi:hypothetical protein